MKYDGPIDVARHVLRSEGCARGLFKGLVPTLAREVPGNVVMFGVYEATKEAMACGGGGQDTSSSQLGRGGARRPVRVPDGRDEERGPGGRLQEPEVLGLRGRGTEDPRRRRGEGTVQGVRPGHGAQRPGQRHLLLGVRGDPVGAGMGAVMVCFA